MIQAPPRTLRRVRFDAGFEFDADLARAAKVPAADVCLAHRGCWPRETSVRKLCKVLKVTREELGEILITSMRATIEAGS